MIFGSDRKKWQNADVQGKEVISEKNEDLWHKVGGRWK